MKNNLKAFLVVVLLSLSSCSVVTPTSKSTNSGDSSQSGGFSASSIDVSTSKENKNGVYRFYCVNDFHGAILERNNSNSGIGISKYFGELKRLKEKDPEHTFIISAGDMYQGSLESNYNYGELITRAMNDVGFDSMTVGNHEFDYGIEPLLANIELAKFPMLGGNIMRYENGATTNMPWNADKFGLSTTIERGGAKVGIVGVIGEGQTTSITSKYVDDMDFVAHESIAKNEAQRLREEEGCDIVILAIHDKMSEANYAANKKYFDGVFCGHSHAYECSMISRVPFVQSMSYGSGISHFDITLTNGKAACSNYEVIESNSYWEEDDEISAIRDSFLEKEEFKTLANAKAGMVNGYLSYNEGIPNIGSKAIYDKYASTEEGLVCGMMNSQRSGIGGAVTYSDIYKATPFTNKIVIASVKGEDIIKEAYYNATYTGDTDTYGSINSNSFYKIAVIDYLAYHKNERKQYDYFFSLNKGQGGEVIAEYETYPFDLVFDYISVNCGGWVDSDDYRNSSPGFRLYG